ncbi:hypothetical protein CHH28_07345 [Bacterioplanes sanyensis]|uniref:VTT domain-containing protein n=1 Tax=Bacterioplanes sanyensis TaxID=1249553 RepID=A0A222FIB6_9GAMM|nr:VTT domain-containing protein [Bacterioplanes sanyensis]ASP38499.1 hypothetical protein CHH28_07345 [Bacterioplanes sanyensis]
MLLEWLPQLTGQLGWLFFLSFAAATLLPLGSEWLLLLLLSQGYDALSLWWVASSGNSLGSAVNFAIGWWLAQRLQQRLQQPSWQRAQRWFQRFGIWTLLLAWLPIVGDPLTFIAGIFKANPWLAMVLIIIGKSVRYAVLVLGYQVAW